MIKKSNELLQFQKIKIMKAYKVEILIVDHDGIGAEEMKDVIENVNYPNDCISPHVMNVTAVDIGEWHDDHPLNDSRNTKAEYKRLFP
jgi:hypothetical protein